jgi:surface antigen
MKIRKISLNSLRLLHGERLLGLLALAMLLVASPFVYADTLQQQINNLSNQNSQKQQTVNTLQLQAGSYQGAIDTLQQQINAIEGAIQASTNQQAKLQQQIIADQLQVDQKKQQLSATLKAMYIDGQTTTIEELASSKDLSDYVDKEEYRTAVQNQLDATIRQIAALQQQQQAQKIQVDQLLATQKQQQTQLDSDRQQQADLLTLDLSQQDQYNQQIKTNQKQISALQAEQARINAQNSRSINVQASGGSGGNCDNGHGNGGYPMSWCNAEQDSLTVSGGFPNRECTSFAYWYFTSQESKPLYVTGNANQWIYTANRPVDRTPEDGAIAVSTAGPFGHVLIVLATPGQSYGGVTAPAGYVITMSMNYDYYGHFIVDERAAGSLYYIH